MAKKEKNRVGIVYSTNPSFQFEISEEEDIKSLPLKQQNLKVQLDKKQRGGKKVTLITGFIGSDEDISELGKMLKSKCGVGGNTKNGEILIQGDHREKVMSILIGEGFKVKRVGG